MAPIVQRLKRMTVEDLYALPDEAGRFVELWYGEPVPKDTPVASAIGEVGELSPANWEHNGVVEILLEILFQFKVTRPALSVSIDTDGFLVSRNPDVLLCPDVALLRKHRYRRGRPWIEGAPELAIEVLSRGNSRAEMVEKRRLYFASGAEQVWLVNPEARTVEVFLLDGRMVALSASDVYTCEGIVDGLVLEVVRLFAPRDEE